MAFTADFTFITNGLTLILLDTSTGDPTVFNWAFGDVDPGPESTSTERNPVFTYTEEGTYQVNLTVSSEGQEGVSITKEAIVNAGNSFTINDIIQFERPPSITLNDNYKNYLLEKWRVYLQAAFEIEDDYLRDETHYTFLQNSLIAKLVIFDLLLDAARNFLASSFTGGNSSEASSTRTAGGNIKKIETGPTNVEWYSSSETLTSIFGKRNGVETSLFDEVHQGICALGNKLRVKLPMCELQGVNPVVPIKTDVKRYLTSHNYLTNNYGQ